MPELPGKNSEMWTSKLPPASTGDDALPSPSDLFKPVEPLEQYFQREFSGASEQELASARQLLQFDEANPLSPVVMVNGVPFLTSLGMDSADRVRDMFMDAKKFRAEKEKLGGAERLILDNLQVHSGGHPDQIKLGKLQAARSFRPVAEESGTDGTFAYLGSGDDVETALLTGFSNVTLEDPALADPAYFDAMLERMRSYVENVQYDQAAHIIECSIEGRPVTVHLSVDPMDDFIKNSVKNDVRFDGVMLFNKAPGMETAEARKVLKDSASVLFDNRNDGR